MLVGTASSQVGDQSQNSVLSVTVQPQRLRPWLWLPNQLLHVYTNIPFLKVVNLRASSRQALAGAAFAIFCQSAACLVLYFLPALQQKLEYNDSSRHDKGDIHDHIMVYTTL